MTDFLYARPSALEGIGRNVDLFGILNYYNTSSNSHEADMKARQADIEILKKDFRIAYGKVINGKRS